MEEMMKLISTYGLALVIVGLLLYFAVQYVLVHLEDYKQKRNIKKHDELATLRNQISSAVEAVIERTLLRTRASRVYVFEFHNGSTSMGGLPFLKMTNTYEALGEGAKSERHKRAAMPMQLYSSFVDAIYNKEYLVINTNNRTDEYSKLVYETLAERDISTIVCAKLMDINRRVIGYLGIDYCNEKPVEESIIQESVRIAQDVAVELGALLSVNKRKG